MADLMVKQDRLGDVIISRNGVDLLRIELFPDESHKGDHLFLIPQSGAAIVETDTEDMLWTHELLRDW